MSVLADLDLAYFLDEFVYFGGPGVHSMVGQVLLMVLSVFFWASQPSQPWWDPTRQVDRSTWNRFAQHPWSAISRRRIYS